MGKRLLEIVASGLGLCCLMPVFGLIALSIKLDSPGPVVFSQIRVGRGGGPFRILKFRTMVHGAEDIGPRVTAAGDVRITRLGAFLRSSKMDELPQLINVFVGQMSLVGPRPEVPEFVALYDEFQRKVLDIKPGITDPASVKYRRESEILANSKDPHRTYVEEVMPEKIRINLEYAEGAGVVTDLKVILGTLLALVPIAGEVE